MGQKISQLPPATQVADADVFPVSQGISTRKITFGNLKNWILQNFTSTQIQSNWTQTNNQLVDYIKNKPTGEFLRSINFQEEPVIDQTIPRDLYLAVGRGAFDGSLLSIFLGKIPNATQLVAGLMKALDKKKLDNLSLLTELFAVNYWLPEHNPSPPIMIGMVYYWWNGKEMYIGSGGSWKVMPNQPNSNTIYINDGNRYIWNGTDMMQISEYPRAEIDDLYNIIADLTQRIKVLEGQ